MQEITHQSEDNQFQVQFQIAAADHLIRIVEISC